MSTSTSEKKSYHKEATGAALVTAKAHAAENGLKLYGACFCPFVQRIWIGLEHNGLPYQYIETDPYAKTAELVAISPQGLVPALRHDEWSSHESTVLQEYIEELSPSLLPAYGKDPRGRADARLWADYVNRQVIPNFYRLQQAQKVEDQVTHAKDLADKIETLIRAADPEGPFFAGPELGWVDVTLAPWIIRFSRVLEPYRGWPAPVKGSRWAKWVDAVEATPAVAATTSNDELYTDSYQRYAENRPNTSQVADAINAGRGLP